MLDKMASHSSPAVAGAGVGSRSGDDPARMRVHSSVALSAGRARGAGRRGIGPCSARSHSLAALSAEGVHTSIERPTDDPAMVIADSLFRSDDCTAGPEALSFFAPGPDESRWAGRGYCSCSRSLPFTDPNGGRTLPTGPGRGAGASCDDRDRWSVRGTSGQSGTSALGTTQWRASAIERAGLVGREGAWTNRGHIREAERRRRPPLEPRPRTARTRIGVHSRQRR